MNQSPSSFDVQKFDIETKIGLWRVMNEAAIANGRIVINATLLASGGAIVALLALLGTLLGKDTMHRELIPGVTHVIALFATSLFVSIVTAGFSYLSSYCFSIESKLIVERVENKTVRWERAGKWFANIGIFMGTVAIAALGYGAWTGLSLLQTLG
ncbi:hypothetical protein [Dyella sp. C11]|uniref:hypothetical protein n=1 Tax=Dyella sp. C11 TaxID=2126991 RepID=UPI000D6597EE|nr:hypothetical protein [Dyella sp. C11]